MVVEELVGSLGFEFKGQAGLQRFQSGMDNARRGVHGLSTAAKQAAVAMGGLQNSFKTAFLGGFAGGSAAQLTETIVRSFRDMTIGVAKSVIETGESFETLAVRLETLEGSSEGARKALDWVVQFAKDTPLQIEEVTEAYARLRNFGIDPSAGSLAALTDATAAQGKDGEHLLGIITAVGQAWTKQKFQAEEANQLLERGVPAWNLLSEATGKSVAELMKLSEAGKIGQREISLLIQEIGKKYTGASAKMAQTSKGIRSVIKDTLTTIKRQVADAGWFDLWKQQLTDVRGWLEDLAKNKSIKRWAWDALFWLAQVREFFRGKEFQDFIKTTMRELESLGTLLNGLKLGENTLREWETLKNTFGEIESTLAFVSRWVVQIWEKLQIPENILKGWERLSGWMSGIGSAVGKVFDQHAPKGGIRRRGPTSRSGGDAMRQSFDERDSMSRSRSGVAARARRSEMHRNNRPLPEDAPELVSAINNEAVRLGVTPEDYATMISFETAGSFDKWKKGPVTKWGRHRGYIQWGTTGAMKDYGVHEGMSPAEQLSKATQYALDRGFKPGMGPAALYSTINTGGPHTGHRSDAAAGGTPGSAIDKWHNQMDAHRARARQLLSLGRKEPGLPDPFAGKDVGTGPTGLAYPRGDFRMPPIRPGAFSNSTVNHNAGASFRDNSQTVVKVKVAGTRATADEIGGAVGRAIRNRGRDVAKSLFIEAQEPQSA